MLLWNSRGPCAGSSVCCIPSLGAALAHRPPCPRLAEKKASIGYTYEDSTVAEVDKVAEKPEEEESPAEEESNSDEDEVIPDIGGVPSLPSPSLQSLGIVFRVSSLTLRGAPCAHEPRRSHPCCRHSSPRRPHCLTHVLLFPASLSVSPFSFLGPCFMTLSQPRFWLRSLPRGSASVSPSPSSSLLGNKYHPVTEAPLVPHPAVPLPPHPSIQTTCHVPPPLIPAPTQPPGDSLVHMKSVHPTSISRIQLLSTCDPRPRLHPPSFGPITPPSSLTPSVHPAHLARPCHFSFVWALTHHIACPSPLPSPRLLCLPLAKPCAGLGTLR